MKATLMPMTLVFEAVLAGQDDKGAGTDECVEEQWKSIPTEVKMQLAVPVVGTCWGRRWRDRRCGGFSAGGLPKDKRCGDI